jgi:hypothetical protein
MEIIQEMHPGLQKLSDEMDEKTRAYADGFRGSFTDIIVNKYKSQKTDELKEQFKKDIKDMMEIILPIYKKGSKAKEGGERINMKETSNEIHISILKLLKTMGLERAHIAETLQIFNIYTVFKNAKTEIEDYENSIINKIKKGVKKLF